MSSLENELKREARWTLMLSLYHSRDIGIHEGMIGVIFQDMHYSLSAGDIRSMLIYLQELGYCRTDKKFDDKLWVVITAKGVDLCEHNSECPDSIARPSKKYW
jgi:hypothetical protein